ncbi:hypothetical protein [Streptomyces minutiscleroticus]|uniref:Uncharacterized protein n=1 Tax=Streptomyces minutiscleroticus TaxID=68238 RepID=A0A918NRG5_9ACTN|nr:hypothetical protein [Streptomyces minutiscleroticus]GGX89379.1 hypothetical protein GCM10010358_49150 [Streptomyces minutiscleroticus]
MTTPEENRPKTETTEPLLEQREGTEQQPAGATGRTLREALEEADVNPEDFEEK